MMYSFDVFDTLIGRVLLKPEDIHVIIKERLLQNSVFKNIPLHIKDGFDRYRVAAEVNCRQLAVVEEITLQEIYKMISRMTGCAYEELREIEALEEETEIEISRPIRVNIDLMKEILASGEKVVLISDIYLSEQAVRKILCQHDIVFENVPIYVSSEWRVQKKTGALYKVVKNNERIEYQDWTHIGDNKISDGVVPKMLGIKTICRSEGNGLCKKTLPCNMKDTFEQSLIQGMYQKAYQHMRATPENEVGFFVGGPILYAYIKWLLKICMRKSIDKLLFLSRDGYILKKIADIIIKQCAMTIETEYVYSSREAWRIHENDVVKKELLRDYLNQFGVNDGKKVAFVDSQGTGQTVMTMEKICEIDVPIFFFCMQGSDITHQINWFVYSLRNDPYGIIELLCYAPHPRTLGYKKERRGVFPFFDEQEMTPAQLQKYKEYEEGVLQFSETMSGLEKRISADVSLEYYGEELMCEISANPSDKVIDYLGQLPDESRDGKKTSFAPIVSFEKAKRIANSMERYQGLSFEYAIKRFAKKDQKAIKRVERSFFSRTLEEKGEADILIAVYGAGKIGKEAIRKLSTCEDVWIVLWVDLNYEKYKRELLPVNSPEELKKHCFDKVLIAVGCYKERIVAFLAECGIPAKKIITSIDDVH